MKTIIAINNPKKFTSRIINIASEFFGVRFDPKKKSVDLFLMFPTIKAAREFQWVIHEFGIETFVYDRHLNKFI